MKTMISAIAVSVSLLAGQGSAAAADRATADEAVAMVKKAVAMIKSDGLGKTYAKINDPANSDFHDRELYVFVYNMEGVAMAQGNNSRLVGKNLIGLRDVDGKYMIKDMVETAQKQGKGWVEYKWPNPVTQAIDQKSGYVERVGDVLVGSGIYK